MLLIHSFNRYIVLSTNCVPEAVPGAGDGVVEKVTEKLERSKHTDIDERQIYSI